MPNNIIKSFAQKSNKSEQEVEKIWDELKSKYGEDYQRIVGALKKILMITESQNFREFISEDRRSNEYGLFVNGQLLDLSINMNNKNSLIEVDIKGKRTLVKLKSLETLKKEYNDESHKQLEKIWKNMTAEKSKEIEELVYKFEKDLNTLIIEMEKEISSIN